MLAPEHNAAPPAAIVFFDGECPLCNRSVAFLARHDRAGRLSFAHLQGATAQRLLDPGLRNAARDGTVVLLEQDAGGRSSVRSAAVLRALAHAAPRWGLLAGIAGSPLVTRILDLLYAFVARHRDDWFGRHDTCALPDASFRARFID